MVKAIFFDFWGTLAENGTYSPMKQTYNILRVRMPFGEFAEKLENTLMTKPFEDQATAFTEVCKTFNATTHPVVIDKLIGVWNKNKLLAKLYPETIDTLKALKEKKIKIILVSNAPSNSVEPVLEKFEMNDLFDGIFLSHQHGKLKTTGLFEIALKKHKLKPEQALSIGDSMETDIKGAEAAGIKAYLIDRKGRREYENKISSLTEILDLVGGKK
ncbi:HAD family hydrolase [Candidatus Woesearchaeota archaeon]|nr:HAD family hydrolase [Candidatus Woesearchaeota archaeon]MBW3016268.1 HAD family hydrolase [Candidatus Woesearchaeota archaeon]